jgi:glycosyltransferase involved in cell wall biosynthesis
MQEASRLTPEQPERDRIDVSVVVPVYNEAPALPELCQQIRDVLELLGKSWEILFVDDGSTDESYSILASLQSEDCRMKVIQLRKNYGKAAALSAGFHESRGEIILTIDGDLQDDPQEIPRMVFKLAEGFDLICGWKRPRRDPPFRVFSSKVFNTCVRLLSGLPLHDLNSGLKAMSREVVEEIPLHGDLYRFMPFLAHWRGFRVGEVTVHHRPRPYGKSKYGWDRAFRGVMDLITVWFLTRFQRRPAHFFGMLGSLVATLGGVVILYILYLRLAFGNIQNRHPLLIGAVVFVVVGVQLFTTGLLGELLVEAQKTRESDYVIRRRVG